MEKTTITKEQLNLFAWGGKQYLINREPSELTKAIESILPEALKKLKKVERSRDLFKISLAKKTGSKHIDLDKNGRYQHTEEDTKKIWEEMDKIDAEKVQLSSHIVNDYPSEDISYDLKCAFQSIVIPAIPVVEYEEEESEKEKETEETEE